MKEEKKNEQMTNTGPLSKIEKIKMRKDQFVIFIMDGIM